MSTLKSNLPQVREGKVISKIDLVLKDSIIYEKLNDNTS